MVKEYSIATASGNNNTPDTSNNDIAAALNNLAQDLATLHTGNQNTQANSSHDPILDPFTSTQPFNLSSHAASTAFQLACELIDVTWD